MKKPKICIVADWLTNMGGAEEVVLELSRIFPDAPIYTSTYTPRKMPKFKDKDIRTTYLQNLPGPLKNLHKFLPTLRVNAFRELDLSEFDIIISSSSAEAKQVQKTRDNQIHICYCHTPIRYYWSHYHEYRKNPGFGKLNWLIRLAMPLIVPRMKKLDFEAAQNVDYFIANSTEIQKRIKKYYQKPSTVIHPPVDISRFKLSDKKSDHYVVLGRQVPYKRHDLAIQACTELDLPLKVFGNGPEHDRLKKIAGPKVEFYTDRFSDASDEEVEKALSNAKGFIFPGEEDFGIVSAEALAAGTPVVAFGRAGTLDIVTSSEIGVLFETQTVEDVKAAIKKLESQKFNPEILRRTATRFAPSMFERKIKKVVKDQWDIKNSL